jgi:hypothetical protein
VKDQLGVGRIWSKRHDLLKIFGKYTSSDIRDKSAVLRILKLVIQSAGHPFVQVPFKSELGPSYVTATSSDVHRIAQEFLGTREAAAPKAKRKKRGKHRRKHRVPGLVDMGASGKQLALQLVKPEASGLRLLYPKMLVQGSQFVPPGRAYVIKSPGHRKFSAYRMVISTGKVGEYYGLQGTTWPSPPILRSPTRTRRIGGVDYRIYSDGRRVRLVAWRSGNGTYWISNTLSESLSERQLLAIAHSTKPLG